MAHTCISKVFVFTHFDRMLYMQQLQHSPGARRLLQLDAIIHPSTPSIWSTGRDIDSTVAAIPSSRAPPPSMSSSDNDTSSSNFDTVNHFSPSVAIIMVALLSAFFFMGFFSLYMRRCAPSSSSNIRASLRRANEFQEQQEEGIDPEFLHSLPLIVYSSAKKKGSNIECVVCLTDFEEHEPLRQLPVCKHVFHQDCIDMWLFSHSTCPLCRGGITASSGSMSVLRSAAGGFRQVSLIGGGGSGQHELTERESGIHRGVSAEMGSTVNSGYQHSEAMAAESNRECHNMDSRRLPVRWFTRSNSTGQMGPADEANSSGESSFPRTSLHRSNSEMVVQHNSHIAL